jgi:transcriptional regulator with XRE-family HTH domain
MLSTGATVRKVRTGLGLGQKEFAAKLGYSRQETVSNWENNRKRPSEAARKKIAQLARKSYEEVWGGMEEASGAVDRGAHPPARDGALSRQIDEILHSDADELTKTGRMIELWGIARQKAISDVTELIRGDREILKARADAVLELCRTARIEAEQAARPAPVNLAPGERELLRAILVREAALHPDRTPPQGGKTNGKGETDDPPGGA